MTLQIVNHYSEPQQQPQQQHVVRSQTSSLQPRVVQTRVKNKGIYQLMCVCVCVIVSGYNTNRRERLTHIFTLLCQIINIIKQKPNCTLPAVVHQCLWVTSVN